MTSAPAPLRVLNDAFRVLSYSGGAQDAEHGIEQVLKPSLRPFHCSVDGLGHIVDFGIPKDVPGVLLTHVVVHGAPGCSERLKCGKIWIGDSIESLGASAAPAFEFETDSVKAEWTGCLATPTLARVVRVSFDSTHGEGVNVDVAMVAFIGVSASDPQPDPSVCISAIPAELGVTELQKVKKRKRWMPLESNPNVMNKYLRKLGFDRTYSVHELMSLESWALDMVPRPARAIFLVFPIGKETEAARKEEDSAPVATPPPPNVVHMKQLVGNACGTIAVVHAMANLCKHAGAIADMDSWLERFLVAYRDGLTSEDVGTLLEEDAAIESAHAEAEGESEARDHSSNANLHFIVFVDIGGLVVELDGRREAPIVVGRAGDHGDFMAAAVVAIRKRYMDISPDALRFNMMALCGKAAPDVPCYPVVTISEDAIAQLGAFGFDRETATGALEAVGGDVEAAANMLLG